MISSPNHPTSNIEDAFSSNFLGFIPASLDCVPTSPGKTYSSSSKSFGVVPIASPSLPLFHDDPYMKVLQAFYAEKSTILPPIITLPSSMPNPQEFFLLENLLSPKKKAMINHLPLPLPCLKSLKYEKVLVKQVWNDTKSRLRESKII
nr:hypothetical protein [Tanacetum cinerariifolium]